MRRKKPRKCALCATNFLTKSNLNKHIGYIHTVHEKTKLFNYGCCDFSSANKRDLARHVSTIHEGKKPYNCNIRDKSFNWSHHLKGHMSSVRDKDKPFKCNICDFATTSMSNLMLHFSRIHEEKKLIFVIFATKALIDCII